MAITGVHTILFSHDAPADRAFLANVLGLASVDAGGGWPVFALPPAELAAHPASADGGGYELYLMCDDIEATVRELKAKGVEFSSDVTRQRWGLITAIELPGGGRLGLYEPLHARPGRRGEAGRMSVIAFSIRIVSAVIAFISQVLMARWMGSFEYGIFVLVWTTMIIIGMKASPVRVGP